MPVRKLFALVLLCVVVGVAAPIVAVKYLGLGPAVAVAPMVEESPAGDVVAPVALSREEPLTPRVPERRETATRVAERVTVRGIVRYRNRFNVVLSDGRTVSEKGPGGVPDHADDVVAVDRTHVTLRSGERYYFALPSAREKRTPAAPVAADVVAVEPERVGGWVRGSDGVMRSESASSWGIAGPGVGDRMTGLSR